MNQQSVVILTLPSLHFWALCLILVALLFAPSVPALQTVPNACLLYTAGHQLLALDMPPKSRFMSRLPSSVFLRTRTYDRVSSPRQELCS